MRGFFCAVACCGVAVLAALRSAAHRPPFGRAPLHPLSRALRAPRGAKNGRELKSHALPPRARREAAQGAPWGARESDGSGRAEAGGEAAREGLERTARRPPCAEGAKAGGSPKKLAKN